MPSLCGMGTVESMGVHRWELSPEASSVDDGRKRKTRTRDASARAVCRLWVPSPIRRAHATGRHRDLTFRIDYNGEDIGVWNWDQMMALPQTDIHTDIHCVTKWSKLDTDWRGVLIDDFLADAGLDEPPADFLMAYSDGGYTTNLPTADIIDGKGFLAHTFDNAPLEPAHGGPIRMVVPHLYFWKSAKWVRGIRFMDSDAPGFWEAYGYHMYGDPWREQRYHYD